MYAARRSRLTVARGRSEVGQLTKATSRASQKAARPQPATKPAGWTKPAGTGWVGSAEQLFMVLQEAGDAITIVDMGGELRYANKAAATAMGFSDAAEAVRLPRQELMAHFELLDADGRPLPE